MLPFLGLWDEWGIQILVLISFVLQVFLLFGRIRRHNASFAFRILVWLVYMLADSTATYTLGQMATSSQISSGQQHLVAFWAPFLLLHLGGQDTITAYALEDNELWLRHLLSLVVQAFGAAYLLYQYIAGGKDLIPASILVFVAGTLKYGERIWALRRATMSSMQESVVKLDKLDAGLFSILLPDLLLKGSTDDCDSLAMYEKIADAAHSSLQFIKRLFVTPSIASEWRCPGDYLNRGVHDYEDHVQVILLGRRERPNHYIGKTYGGPWIQSKCISKVIDLKLSLMYDLLYTKSAVIHTWYGYSIRAFCLFAIVRAFVFFIRAIKRHSSGYKRGDVAVTYVLLIEAFLLEIISIFRIIGSTWTYASSTDWTWYIGTGRKKKNRANRFARGILSLRWHWDVWLGRWFRSLRKVSSGSWSTHTSIGQYNMISMSIAHRRMATFQRPAKLLALDDLWKWTNIRFVQASPAVVEVIYTEIKRRAELTKMEAEKLDYNTRQGRWTRSHDDIEKLCKDVFRRGLIGFILACHIATDILVHCCNENEKIDTGDELPEVAMALSNHMMYLLRVHQDMLPSTTTEGADSWSKDTYDETCNKLLPGLFYLMKKYAKVEIKQERGHRPQDILLIMEKHFSDNHLLSFHQKERYRCSIFRSGSELAAKLLETTEISLRQKFQFLTELWVDTLLYVADGITANFHAKHLSYGGEFVTFVSVLMPHIGLQKQFYGQLRASRIPAYNP